MAINIQRGDGEVSIWSDPEGHPFTGRCIGAGETEEAAMHAAKRELALDMIVLLLIADGRTPEVANRMVQE